MQLHDNPKAVAEAARIKAEKGFDPLDYNVVNAAVSKYRRYFWTKLGWGVLFGVPFAVGCITIAAGIGVHRSGGVVFGLVGAAVLFGIAWFPGGWGYRRAYRRHRDTTMRVINGYVLCLHAAYDDPEEARREEMRWRQAHRLWYSQTARGRRPEGVSSHRKHVTR